MTARFAIPLIVLVTLIASVTPVTQAQDPAPDRLEDLLMYAPDTPNSRAWLTYGDIAGWHASWGVPRPPNRAIFDLFPRIPRAYWMAIMPRQTMPPEALGLQYLLVSEERAFYGFDFFQVDRALAAGHPPETLTVLQHNADPDAIAAQLVESGYTASDIAPGWTLYSILDDYELALGPDAPEGMPQVGALGQRNRIALNGQQMIIARASATIEQALAAAAGDAPALLDDPAYAALAAALHDPLLEGAGDLVGVIIQHGLEYAGDPAVLVLGRATPAMLQALREQYGLDDPANLLPPFSAVAFATFHADDASYLTLALAFPPGADTARAISLLESKMPDYQSLMSERSFADHWALDRSGVADVGGIPVVLVVMRVDDPPLTPANADRVNTDVLSWSEMVVQRDLLFLATATDAGAVPEN